jgi:hypothetical protein
MHDLDRAMFETGELGQEFGHESQETESEQSEHQEFLEVLGTLTGEPAGRGAGHGADRFDRVIGETELATELLEVQESAALDRFLGRLLGRAAGATRDFVRSPTGRALTGILKKAAGEALPAPARGLGALVGGDIAGVGERLGQRAGSLFGLELEGLSYEDREFEVAKAFVRFADAAAEQAATAPPGSPPAAVATAAATTAARRHAPGLLAVLTPSGPGSPITPGSSGSSGQHGRWERRGDRIVIFDV